MKQFIVTTSSESGDHYIYFIEHPKEPTGIELNRFLKENANDIDPEDGKVYESVDEIEEITEFLKIPEKKKTK